MAKKSKRRNRRGADASDVKKKAGTGGGNSTIQIPAGLSFMKLEKGYMYIEVLPYEVTKANHPDNISIGSMWYSRKYGMHFSIGPDERAVLCPKVTFGKRCPICEQYARLRKDVDADEEVVKGFKPKVRELFNIVKHDEDGEERDQGVLDVSHYLFGKKLETEIQEGDEEFSSFSHPDDGFTLKLRVSENDQLSNKFLEVTRIDFDDREEEITDDELDAAAALDDALECKSYEELEAILYGKDGEDDDEEKSSRKRSKRKSSDDEDDEEKSSQRKRRKKSSDDEEEEEEKAPRRKRRKKSSDEEEEEEEKPARRNRKKAKKEDDDPDWEDPEEEEEEKAPRRKRKGKKKAKAEIEVGSRVSAVYDDEVYEGEVTELDDGIATVDFDDDSSEEVDVDNLTLCD